MVVTWWKPGCNHVVIWLTWLTWLYPSITIDHLFGWILWTMEHAKEFCRTQKETNWEERNRTLGRFLCRKINKQVGFPLDKPSMKRNVWPCATVQKSRGLYQTRGWVWTSHRKCFCMTNCSRLFSGISTLCLQPQLLLTSFNTLVPDIDLPIPHPSNQATNGLLGDCRARSCRKINCRRRFGECPTSSDTQNSGQMVSTKFLC